MKRTLRRESKALEIVGREALGARRFGPFGMSSADARGPGGMLLGALSKVPPVFCYGHASAPVHPGGTASISSAGGRGVGRGPGRGACSPAAGRLAGRRPRG